MSWLDTEETAEIVHGEGGKKGRSREWDANRKEESKGCTSMA